MLKHKNECLQPFVVDLSLSDVGQILVSPAKVIFVVDNVSIQMMRGTYVRYSTCHGRTTEFLMTVPISSAS